MLPQTNLQLYRLMMDVGASEASLVQTRAAYDMARRLFVGCFRPSHKQFLCHLVGAAGALAVWCQPCEVVISGLLHSAYLFGNFGDGTRGATAAKRRVIRNRFGAKVESLVECYTRANWHVPLSQIVVDARSGALDPTLVLLKLADLCDECLDGGVRFATAKQLEFGLHGDEGARQIALELLESLAGPKARAHLDQVFAACDGAAVPAGLVTSDRSYHVVTAGVDELRRSRIRLRLRRFARGLTGKKAA